MFAISYFFIMNFCYEKKCSVSKSITVLHTVDEEIRKIFFKQKFKSKYA